jgi:N-methylhydantoinase A
LPAAAGLRARFLAAHETAYGYSNPHDPVEVVNFRLTARGRLHRAPPAAPVDLPGVAPAPLERREVWFGPDAALATPVFERAALRPGQRLVGPAVIEQLELYDLRKCLNPLCFSDFSLAQRGPLAL